MMKAEEQPIKVGIKNTATGERRAIKVGFSWTLLLFSGLLGLPLFRRRLQVWGRIFLALWLVHFVGPLLVDKEALVSLEMFTLPIFLGLTLFMGLKGNEMTAKNYLKNGWTFEEPESEDTQIAKRRWGIAV